MHFIEKNTNFNKNETKSKRKIPHTILEGKYNNCKLKEKL